MTTHRGSCHCGAVRFEFEGDIAGAEVCNCSICSRTGFLHWYTAPDRFRLLAGDEALSDYRFGTRTAQNLFCRTCGISAFRRARSDPDKVDINLRCVQNLDVESLELTRFDGRHWEDAMRHTRGSRRE